MLDKQSPSPQRILLAAPHSRVLAELQATLLVVSVLTNAQQIAEFVAEALVNVPGISACRVCFEGCSSSAGEFLQECCNSCPANPQAQSSSNKAPSHACDYAQSSSIRYIPLATTGHNYGYFVFKINDKNAYQIYEPFLINYGNFIAISMENRQQKIQLENVNNHLQEQLIAKDITQKALRRSESKYKMLSNNAPVMIHSVDENDVLLSVSDFWLESLGYTRKEVLGRRWQEFISLKSRLLITQESKTNSINTALCKDVSLQFVKRNGGIIDVLFSATSQCDYSEIFTRSVAVITDITDRLLAEEKLRQSQKIESIGQLTGGVAHDFNNILAVLMGNLEAVLQRSKDNEWIQDKLSRALRAVERGANLTQQLLSFSRKQSLHPKMSSPGELLLETSQLLIRTLGENISINTDLSCELPKIMIDPGLLEAAIINLATNARDAMPRGGELIIDAHEIVLSENCIDKLQTGKPGYYVQINVIDEGCGISQDALEHVYEPFFTTKDVGMGSGLGLSMVFGFVQQSGGFMTIASQQDKGTKVSLFLPCDNSPQPQQIVSDKPSKDHSEDQLGNGETILLVEDDPALLFTTAELLKRLNYKVIKASNGPIALAILEAENSRIDLLFSDMVMPSGLSGVDIVKQTRSKYPHIKSLLTTGYPLSGPRKYSYDTLQSALLTKPYSMEQLAEKISFCLSAELGS
ncbi:MAG: hypothetical protein COC19_06015 [SAR86 cluster bacterium]|uniref:histidine kinase n=1 Tax=SAR86 cluster bacterium TaxID=2030880 RepID=A0A2A4ML83_9GAMM|nr:MAG: hypothetical protein COC19_06015 [SAR86 cluster bacterium]